MRDNHISWELMKELEKIHLVDLDHGERVASLYYFMKIADLIQRLGWFEHTSDWDPYITITYSSFDTYETESGYYDIWLSVDGKEKLTDDQFQDYIQCRSDEIAYIIVLSEDEDGNETEHPFEIDDMKAIEITR